MKRRTKIVGLIFSALLSAMVFTGCGAENGAILNNLANPAQTSVTIHPDSKATLTQHGYSITINQIRFDRDATRVFVTIKNNGKYTLYLDDPICIQRGKQYGTILDLKSDYNWPETSLVRGAYTDGVFTFPSLPYDDCQIIFNTLSDDSRDFVYETFKPYTFHFTTESQTIASQTVSSKPSSSKTSQGSSSPSVSSNTSSTSNGKTFTKAMAQKYESILLQYPSAEYALYDIDQDHIPELIVKSDFMHYIVYTINANQAVNCGDFFSSTGGIYQYNGNGILAHDGGSHIQSIDRHSLVNCELKTSSLMDTGNGKHSLEDIANALEKYTPIGVYPISNHTILYKMAE